MSGYFVHGGTQYAYSQNTQQQTPAQTNIPSYQQPAQTTQFYQSTSYPTGQSTRTVLPTSAAKSTVGSLYGSTSYNTPTLGQNYSSPQRTTPNQSYSTYDTSNTYARQNTSTDNYNRTSYNTATNYATPSYGGIKQEEKYSSANTFGGYKANPTGNSSLGSTSFGGNTGSNSYFSQPSSFSTSYPNTASYNKPEEASSSQYSYEKALYVAANQYYLNKKAEATRGGGGGRGAIGGGMGRGRGGRGRGGMGRGGSSYQGVSTGPKIIKATEVKAYLYAWCGQRRLKPEYTIEPMGMPPKMKFCCTLKITGLDYTAKVTAASKKDSQSKAAWDFCEHLLRTGFMKQSELPEKPVDPAPKSINPPKPSTPVGTEPAAAETIEESGGWTLENCRQRLNQFTQRWRIPAEFKHETHGPEHARNFIAELSVRVKWLDKIFHARERGNNKKQATAVCALAMIRQLYKENLIEKQGDPIKHPNRRPVVKEAEKKPEQSSPAGLKRKADGENGAEEFVDDYGNWKLEDGRQRLHMFCQATNQPFEIKYAPDGNTPPRMFKASVAVDVNINGEKSKVEKSHLCAGKKQAAQHCALQMIKHLYQLSLVEANVGLQQSKKKNPRQQRQFMEGPMPLMDASFGGPMYPPGPMFSPFGGPPPPPQRRTPHEDALIFEKHRRIYPSEFELNLIQKTVRTIENTLKQVSDQLSELETEAEDGDDDKKPADSGKLEKKPDEKRVLQGVMRVDALAKGLLLNGDLSAQLVLLSVEIPTASLLTKISSLLSKSLEESGETYMVEVRISECCVNITSPAETNDKEESVRCLVKVSLTSPLMRKLEPATGPADMLDRDKCISSLAELRHAKWFQACASGLSSCVVLIRIFLDMKKRISTWAPLTNWALELIVQKSLSTYFGQQTAGEGLRRILSCLSSGILLEDGCGLYDPCEKVPTDVISGMTLQEREDITESAHHALRMLVFRQTHKILGIEPMPTRSRRSTEGDHGMET